ncbi:hypothetical protein K456DRAFT_60366 [Colletotrichum gloeosporioides 23]|nr:hypothetical protein K456DRAFT_60366 [Colletotrichum gloeosporioides 23]
MSARTRAEVPRLWTSHAENVDLSAEVEEVCRDMRFSMSNKIPADIHSFLVQGDRSRTVFGDREPSVLVRMTMGEGTSGLLPFAGRTSRTFPDGKVAQNFPTNKPKHNHRPRRASIYFHHLSFTAKVVKDRSKTTTFHPLLLQIGNLTATIKSTRAVSRRGTSMSVKTSWRAAPSQSSTRGPVLAIGGVPAVRPVRGDRGERFRRLSARRRHPGWSGMRFQRASGTATAPPPPTTRRGDAGTASRELRLLDTALAPPTPATCSSAAIVDSLPNRKHP